MNREPVTHATTDIHQRRSPEMEVDAASTGMRGKGFVIPALFLVALLFLQWPMLKGLFYRASGVDAPVSTISWREDFEAALVEGEASDKPLLLVFSASWCPPCIAMKHDVWADTEVSKAVTNGFVPVHIDVDSSELAEVAERYQVRGIPAVLLVDAQGNVLRQESFMSRSETLEFLDATAS